jgi:hypothetical protein
MTNDERAQSATKGSMTAPSRPAKLLTGFIDYPSGLPAASSEEEFTAFVIDEAGNQLNFPLAAQSMAGAVRELEQSAARRGFTHLKLANPDGNEIWTRQLLR